MLNLTPSEMIGYASAVLFLLSLGLEILRRTRPGASETTSPEAFGGLLVSALGFTASSSMMHETFFAVTSGTIAVFAFGGLVLAIAHRLLWRDSLEARMPRPVRPDRVFSVVVRTGQTLDTSPDVARALAAIRSLQS